MIELIEMKARQKHGRTGSLEMNIEMRTFGVEGR